jgi:uncharacterized protein (TIGR02598 family)
LIEVVLALGIVSFAMVSILGLIPVGMTTFREAMLRSVEAGIVQRLAADVQQTGYENLSATNLTFDERGIAVAETEAIFTASVDKPRAVETGGILQSDVAAQTILIRIVHHTAPQTTNVYPVVLPHGL